MSCPKTVMTEKELRRVIYKTIDKEGGYVFDPDDAGGETKFGIAKRFWPDVDIKNLTIEHAFDIYHKFYADPLKIAEIDSLRIGWKIFDFGVNAGHVVSAKAAQKSVGLEPDGFIGPKTLKALNEVDDDVFMMKFVPLQEAHYQAIVDRKPSQAKFIHGWLKRARDVGEDLVDEE